MTLHHEFCFLLLLFNLFPSLLEDTAEPPNNILKALLNCRQSKKITDLIKTRGKAGKSFNAAITGCEFQSCS